MKRTLVVLACLAAAPRPAAACQIPVFRFALENWIPDPYRVVVIHDRPLSPAERRLFSLLEGAEVRRGGEANVVTREIDLSTPPKGGDRWALERFGRPRKLPAIMVLFPDSRARSAAWQAPLDAASVARVLDSPARREIAARLLRGESAVWVVIGAGDRRQTAEVEHTLNERLRTLAGQLRLPTVKDVRQDSSPKVETKIPLRLAFSTLTVARDDPEEAAFVAMLTNSDPFLQKSAAQTLVVPVFGRGRTYVGLVPGQVADKGVELDARFMVGACSCLVKYSHPGTDLLFSVDWEEGVGGVRKEERVDLPSIETGTLRGFPNPPATGRVGHSPPATHAIAAASAGTPGDGRGTVAAGTAPLLPFQATLGRSLALALGCGLVFVTIAAVTMWTRARRRR